MSDDAYRIMIVEDSEDVRKEIIRFFSQKNYEVIEAEDGESGLKKIMEQENPFDVVMTDFHMKEMTGLEMIEETLKHKEKAPGNFVILTTEMNRDYRKKAKEMGVRHWIIKPFEGDQLEPVIGQLIKKTRAKKASAS